MQEEEAAAAAAGAGLGIGILIFYVVILAFFAFVFWKLFEKAGKPGWPAVVPVYNMVVGAEVAGKPAWWVVLMFIPIVSMIISVIWCISFAERFGKGVGFAIGMLLLPFIFYPILAFGDAEYTPPPPA